MLVPSHTRAGSEVLEMAMLPKCPCGLDRKSRQPFLDNVKEG